MSRFVVTSFLSHIFVDCIIVKQPSVLVLVIFKQALVGISRLEVQEMVAVSADVSRTSLVISRADLRIVTLLSILLGFLRILVELTGITSASFNRWYIWRINILLDQSLPGHL